MAYILSIETATNVCAVAIHNDGTLLAHQELFIEKSHSGLLTVIINDLLLHCELSLSNVDAIALSEGPGSYTGLRIGTSTAKGLAYSIDIPLIAVSTLEAMCRSILLTDHNPVLLCPMLDARRMEVYCLLTNQDYEVVEEVHPCIVDEDSFGAQLDSSKIIFFGNGASKCKDVIVHDNAIFLDDITPNAKNIGVLAFDKYNRKEFVDVAYFEPFYLKDFRPTTPKVVL